jgi:hypothetical protein
MVIRRFSELEDRIGRAQAAGLGQEKMQRVLSFLLEAQVLEPCSTILIQ